MKIKLSNIDTPKELLPYYSDIHTKLLNKEFSNVNDFIKGIDIDKSSILVLMGFSRLLYPWYKKIDYWKTYTRLVYDEINSRGENADSIMRGVSCYIMTDLELINEAAISKNDYYLIHRIMHKFNISHTVASENINHYINDMDNHHNN